MSGTVLPVTNIPGGVSGSLGAIEDLGVSQDGARSISLVSPSGSQGDQVEILGGNDPSMDDAFFIGNLFTTNALAGGSADAGQNSALSTPLVFRYARTVRIAGTAALVCEVGAAAPAGGTIANAILNGGQTVGPDGEPVDLLDVIHNGGALGGPIPEWLYQELGGNTAGPLASLLSSGGAS
jgi:hypothetical protein